MDKGTTGGVRCVAADLSKDSDAKRASGVLLSCMNEHLFLLLISHHAPTSHRRRHHKLPPSASHAILTLLPICCASEEQCSMDSFGTTSFRMISLGSPRSPVSCSNSFRTVLAVAHTDQQRLTITGRGELSWQRPFLTFSG